MTRKPPSGERRSRSLSKEDQVLWDSMAASLEPLKQKAARVRSGAERQSEDGATETRHKLGKSASTRLETIARPSAQPVRAPAKAPELNPFDPKAARRLRKGQVEIDARIDLHGMRQGEAHAALRRFLHSAFARGLRWVLVITGKGAPSRGEWDSGMERGVLKRNVPIWLAEADLRAIIVSYTTAAIAHGGEGALYVHLRNPERMRSR